MNYPYRLALFAPATLLPEVGDLTESVFGDAPAVSERNLSVTLTSVDENVAFRGGCGAATEEQANETLQWAALTPGARAFVWNVETGLRVLGGSAGVPWGWEESLTEAGLQRTQPD